jgi:two-component system, NtrC family, sensor kinase
MQKLTTSLLIFFFTAFVALLHAQDSNTLLEQLEYEKEKVQKATLMFKLGVEYQKQNAFKKAIEYFTEAKRNQENNSSFENECNQKILQSYKALKDYKNALNTVDDLIKNSKQSNIQGQLIKNLNEGVELAELVKDYEKGREYNQELAEIYKENEDFTELGRVYNNLGVINRRKGNNQESRNFFNEALENNINSLKSKNNSLKNQVFTNINTGVTYLKLNQYSKADPYFNKALNIAQKSGDQKLLASAYNYLAMSDYLNDRNANAIGFANKARTIAELNNDSENKLNAYKVLALLYQSEEDYKESIIYNDKYTELLTKIEKQNQEEIQKNLQFEIEIEKKEAEFKSSIAEKQQQVAALKQSELEKEQQRLTLENQKKELAILKQDQALQLAKIREQQLEEQRTKNMLELTKQKAETDRQKAETDRQKAQTEKQKLLTEVQQREATLQAEKAKSQQKIAQEERKAKEASLEKGKLQEDKLKQQFWINLLALGIVLLILGILFFVYRTLKQSKKLNNELAEKNNIIENANQELKASQAQLIQSEKMASLGELTAGIAHEIQNPLNFVNNFSELSVDLAKELKEELEKLEIPEKDKEYVNEIIGDLSKNQEKINHHGKRASNIVKGMLEHSKASTGVKEPTDINGIADESLRLAFHSLKAIDKDFNSSMETHFDPNLPKIDVIPQDIGRALLNLITNAFYAVNERSKTEEIGYEPKVIITTQITANSHVLITVQDNGSGIPDSIKDKIFQPFFTTKPTGQGTGLGLSLSYEIVKAHRGELNIESSPETGAKFIISLPL